MIDADPRVAARRIVSVAIALCMVQASAFAAGPIEHVITYGQSLAAGGASLPLQSTVQPYDSLMFNGGVRTSYTVSDRPSLYASLVPLVESINGQAGETPTAGTLEMINDLRFSENGVSYTRVPNATSAAIRHSGGRGWTS